MFRDDLAAESYRRNIKTELHHKRDDIAEIPVFHIERRNPETGSQAGQQGQDDEKRQQQHMPAGCELIIDHHSDQDNETDEEINESGYQGRRGNDQSGKVNLADQIGVADQTVGRFTSVRLRKGTRGAWRQRPSGRKARFRRWEVWRFGQK